MRLGIAPRPTPRPAAEHAHIGDRDRGGQAHWRVATRHGISPGACTIRTSSFTYTARTALPPPPSPVALQGDSRRAGHEGVVLLGPRSGSSQTAGHSPLLIPCIACRACAHVCVLVCAGARATSHGAAAPYAAQAAIAGVAALLFLVS